MEHCKKITSWDIYGVRKFPYRGKRKYSPGIDQTFNGSIIIQNDVFGLTIHQFERKFKACLERRKEKEQWILNIRFPDKTSKEYYEYLKYGDCTVEGINLIEDEMLVCTFLNFIHVAGTELEIRDRQRMFIIAEKISKKTLCALRQISSGSLAEGIDLPGSDFDVMFEMQRVTVTDDLKDLHPSMIQTMLMMDNETRHPGFCKLKLIAGRYCTQFFRNFLLETNFGFFMSTEKFINLFSRGSLSSFSTRHGPCLSDVDQNIDQAICLRSKRWPQIANSWINRHRSGQWPTDSVINSVVNDGCLFVPIGPKYESDELLWRISFSLAEKRLAHSFNYTQFLCYILLKLTLKNIINRNQEAKDLLCSYFLKTTVFWLSEEIPIDTFKISNLSYWISLCIDKLMSFVRNCYCPNYFIPQHNMFIRKVNESNNELLLSIIGELKYKGLKLLIDRVLGTDVCNHILCTMTDKNIFSVNIDILFFRVPEIPLVKDIANGYEILHYIKLLMSSESSEFILGILRYQYAVVNQLISQMLVLPEHSRECDFIIRRCKKHLMDGTKTDAVSGWLLYASFYYVLGQYKKTIQIVDNVLSRCTPDMIPLCRAFYTTEDIMKYKHKTERHPTLNHRMRQGTISVVHYIKQSALIPQELQLEVQDGGLFLPSVILGNALLVFSFQKLNDLRNQKRALRQLFLTIKEKYLFAVNMSSQSLVILGVCYEKSGDRDTAYHCYNVALHCEYEVCRSAEQRIANLFRHKHFVL